MIQINQRKIDMIMILFMIYINNFIAIDIFNLFIERISIIDIIIYIDDNINYINSNDMIEDTSDLT
jgi:hypothetical protein